MLLSVVLAPRVIGPVKRTSPEYASMSSEDALSRSVLTRLRLDPVEKIAAGALTVSAPGPVTLP